MLVTRRGFLGGLGLLLAAPAIVKAASLMPVRQLPLEWEPYPLLDFAQHGQPWKLGISGFDQYGAPVEEVISYSGSRWDGLQSFRKITGISVLGKQYGSILHWNAVPGNEL